MTNEIDLVNNSLDVSQDENIILVSQIFDIENKMIVLEAKNQELKKKMRGVTNTIFKGKKWGKKVAVGAWE